MRSHPRGVRGWSRASGLLLVTLAVLTALRLLSEGAPFSGDVVRHEGPLVVRRAVDGDTLLLADGQRVRLIGVDTPETKHPDKPVEPLGIEAAEFTQSLVAGRPVRLEFDRQRLDRYRRVLAYVYLPDGRLLNAELIRAGFSTVQTGFPYRRDMQQRFRAAEDEARTAHRGLWQTDRSHTGHDAE